MFQHHEDSYLPSSSSSSSSSSSCPPQDLHDLSQLLVRRYVSSFEPNRDDNMWDDGYEFLGVKKRRLNIEQVKALEKSFELGNKLKPDRKMELARDLGLQAPQVAIWFQNRRARWKTKQMEENYIILKRRIESIKADNNALKSQNKKLHSQLLALKSGENNLNKAKEGSWSNESDDNRCSKIIYNHPVNGVVSSSSTGFGAARPDHFQGHEIDHNILNHAFIGMDENQGFWPWPQH